MSAELVLDLTTDGGGREQKRVPLNVTMLSLSQKSLAGVSDNIAQLTRVAELLLVNNALSQIPAGVLAMTQLTWLNLRSNRLVAVPPEIARLSALTHLLLHDNRLAALPREIGLLRALERLVLSDNRLTSLPAELGQLRSLSWLNVRLRLEPIQPCLTSLQLQRNELEFLPRSLGRLSATTTIYLGGNPLPINVGSVFGSTDSRSNLPELFAATTWPTIDSIRDDAVTLAVGLQDLDLPALVTLEILDAAFANSIPMHKKWDLVVAVKHFHQRRAQ